jgi:hypothetical protein
MSHVKINENEMAHPGYDAHHTTGYNVHSRNLSTCHVARDATEANNKQIL